MLLLFCISTFSVNQMSGALLKTVTENSSNLDDKWTNVVLLWFTEMTNFQIECHLYVALVLESSEWSFI